MDWTKYFIFLHCLIPKPLENNTIKRNDLTLIRSCLHVFLLFSCLDENGRPMTALKNDVSFSDQNLPVEEWLTRDFKVTGCNAYNNGRDFSVGETDSKLFQLQF